MTNYETDKIKAAIAECDFYISKEERNSEDLRPESVKVLLRFYKNHKADLETMLKGV